MAAPLPSKAERDDERRLALTREKAATLSGLTLRQIDYWAQTGLLEPSTDRQLSPGTRIRLYSFVDVLALLVAAELKARKVSLQHIRAVVEHLRSRGYDHPLTEVVFATVGNRVYFQHADGSWEGDLRPDQLVIHEVLNLLPLRRRIREATTRQASLAGKTERRRGVKGSKPLIAGTRLPVETVRRHLKAGRSDSEIMASFPVLTAADLDAVRAGVA